MKFECPNCKKSGQVDDSKIPESGVYATCPQCNNRFLVKREVPKDFEFEPVEPIVRQSQIDAAPSQSSNPGEPSKTKTDTSAAKDDIVYYKAAIGKNFEKYIDVIKAIQAGTAKPVSWHWPAFLVGPTWFLYRKMYGVFFLYLLAAVVLNVLASFKPELGLIFLGMGAVFAVYAKSIYVKHVSKKIESCGQMNHTDKINRLQADCGTNTWIFYFGVIPVIGIIAAIAIPQFSAYRERAYKKAAAPAPAVYQAPTGFIDPYDPPAGAPASAVGTDIWAGLTEPNAAAAPSSPPGFKPYTGFLFDSPDIDCGVTDPQTGLIWTRNGNIAGRPMNWNDAMRWVKNLNYGGYYDWRLPTHKELMALAARGRGRRSDWFNVNGFNNVQAQDYWTSSTYSVKGETSYGMVQFGDGGDNNKTVDLYVWPVRGGR